MSDFQDFIHSRVLRHPTTWIVAVVGGIYGGLGMYGIREVWIIAGLLENANVWIRQVTLVALYLGINWLTQCL